MVASSRVLSAARRACASAMGLATLAEILTAATLKWRRGAARSSPSVKSAVADLRSAASARSLSAPARKVAEMALQARRAMSFRLAWSFAFWLLHLSSSATACRARRGWPLARRWRRRWSSSVKLLGVGLEAEADFAVRLCRPPRARAPIVAGLRAHRLDVSRTYPKQIPRRNALPPRSRGVVLAALAVSQMSLTRARADRWRWGHQKCERGAVLAFPSHTRASDKVDIHGRRSAPDGGRLRAAWVASARRSHTARHPESDSCWSRP